MRKKGHQESGTRSLRTLFLYIGLVFLVILISLSIKAFFVFKSSLYDGKHHMAVAVVKEGSVDEIIAFHPKNRSLSLLEIDGKLSPASVGQILGFVPDATIEAGESFPTGADVKATMATAFMQLHSIKTDMTVFDAARLALYTRSVSEDNKIVKKVQLPRQESQMDKIMTSFFGDERISSDNVPIHIINASDTPGMGKRLERVLNNLGGNVISVSTANASEAKSKIEYTGEKESYTVIKLKRLLDFPTTPLKEQSIADIVITVGEDSKKTSSF